ncbi:hypothetical protein ACF1HJ_31540 [Streptomyces sp. NPDC013978]|uniref:hypothetical protein n=1 Tax=Streptomyces sp. NPDC013978 TaxID=3364869 RepID=UPI0036FBD077
MLFLVLLASKAATSSRCPLELEADLRLGHHRESLSEPTVPVNRYPIRPSRRGPQ